MGRTAAKKTKAKGNKGAMPADLMPMLATLVSGPPAGHDWTYEVKWDGYRSIAYLKPGAVEIRSRNNKDFTGKYYPITAALSKWKTPAVLDGELVVLGENGHPDFGALQNWRSEADGPLVYYVFDLLWHDGHDLMQQPLVERRRLLKELVGRAPKSSVIRLSEDFAVSGKELYALAERMGLEGIMAKRKDSVYAPGYRSREWMKVKTEKRTEAVVGGYTINEGSPKLFSALLLGIPGKNGLEYLTPVGTGFSVALQRELLVRLKPLRRSTCPFTTEPDYNKPSRFRPDPPKATAVWVQPKLVVEISYREMTRDGNLRHPSFKGLREDKSPKEVVLEKPASPAPADKHTSRKKKAAARLVSPMERGERSSLLNPTESTQEKTVKGRTLIFSNLGKVYWPKEGYTKRDMLNYYYQMAAVMLPYYMDKPQTLYRFPNGITGKAFYQKDVKGKVPEWTSTFPYYSEADQREKEFLVISDEASLLYIAAMGCIEINPWNSRTAKPDSPDWCVIDLDPDRNTFIQVIETAQVTLKILDAIGVAGHAKTSGSTGIHVYIPLQAKYSYEASREFARLIATLVHRELPRFTSIERLVANRQGRMYIDFLQNRPQATVAGPYSVRPKPGAPVSMPLERSELKKGLRITDHHIRNAVARVREVGDLFKPVMGRAADLDKAISKAHRLFDDLPSGLGTP